MSFQIQSTNEQMIHLHLAPKTATGKDAKIDGGITYVVAEGSDATVLETGTDAITGAPIDNMNPMFVSGSAAMENIITASFDADLGEGVETITQEFSYIVTQATATAVGITADAPQAKP